MKLGDDAKGWVALGLLLAFFVALNLTTICWHPAVGVDEVSYSDPAVNAAIGKGFTATTWAGQASTEFWSSNAPLHQYLLVPWLKLFGVNIYSVRSINLFFLVIASILLWRWFEISGLVSSTSTKFVTITVLWCSEIVSYIYRDGRPDAITVLLSICTLFIFFLKTRRKMWYAVLVGAFSVVAGIQLPPFVCIILFLTFLFSQDKRQVFKFGFAYCIGVIGGLVLLLAFLYVKQSAYTFLTQTFASGFTVSGDVAQYVVYNDNKVFGRVSGRLREFSNVFNLYCRDSSIVLLLIGLFLLSVYHYLVLKSLIAVKFILAFLVVPPAILFLGRFPPYYSWMSFLVLLIGFSIALDKLPKGKLMLAVGFSVVIFTSGLGRTLFEHSHEGDREQRAVHAFVQKYVTPSDWVYGDHSTFYACKKFASGYYSPSYSGGRGLPEFPQSERMIISKLIIRADQLTEAKRKLGGEWFQKAFDPETQLILYTRNK